ncbi:MAG: class II D-tagatose-bisphosphate aldolase, non-catalytic subunit, partial [Spirochaetes bacterium]|nr:class II D-tagatose-bisphosphate aldolase, non-catalytic subunit [Spirochaetota bacterium]
RIGSIDGGALSNLGLAVERAMLEEPGHWDPYYRGDAVGIALARRYSRSDRIRYYWSREPVRRALERLMENLGRSPVPATLLEQYFPLQARRMGEGTHRNAAPQLVRGKIREVLEGYQYAASGGSSGAAWAG